MRLRLVAGTLLLTTGLVLYNTAPDTREAFYVYVSVVLLFVLSEVANVLLLTTA